MSNKENSTEELQEIRQEMRANRRQVYRKSKLDEYTFEIVNLHRKGASYREIQYWLLHKKKVHVAVNTVFLFIQRILKRAGL